MINFIFTTQENQKASVYAKNKKEATILLNDVYWIKQYVSIEKIKPYKNKFNSLQERISYQRKQK